jgi:hypothetical protein
VVRAPRKLQDLVKIKTRSRLGGYQLRARFGGRLPGQNERGRHTRAWLGVLGRPGLWIRLPAYLWVNALSRARAKRQLAGLASYVWERDESAREAGVAGAS